MNSLVLIFCLFNVAIVLSNGFKIPDTERSQQLSDNIRAKRSPQGVVEAGKEIFANSITIPAKAAQDAFGTMVSATNMAVQRNRRNANCDEEHEDPDDAEGNFPENFSDNSRVVIKRETDESYDDPSIFSTILDAINDLVARFIANATEFFSSLRSRGQADPEEDEP